MTLGSFLVVFLEFQTNAIKMQAFTAIGQREEFVFI
jgi:hypothetical protein